MKQKRIAECDCPLVKAMSALGNKWKPVIVRVIKDRTLRFGEIAARIHVISRKVLTDQLREMEQDGLVTRAEFKELPPRVEYTLTEKGWHYCLFYLCWRTGKNNMKLKKLRRQQRCNIY